MKRKHAYRQQFFEDELYDFENADYDNENLKEFEKLLFDELLFHIKKVPFDDIINRNLTFDGSKFPGNLQINSLNWFYTAHRLNISGKIVYSFRFASPCHPEHYESLAIEYHDYFKLSSQHRHDLTGWYKYIGRQLPEQIGHYLKIDRVVNNEQFTGASVFVNTKNERLDIVFYLRYEQIVITIEPGSPARD